jgi:hypothetical protein
MACGPVLRAEIRDFYVTKYRYQEICGFDQVSREEGQ